jgi:RND family efflux transporter MFP subunit
MKNLLKLHARSLALAAVLIVMLVALAYVALRTGPMAPIPVMLVTVERQAVTPALFGVGTVEARRTHKIGPTYAGRVRRVEVQAGDSVKAGQLLGEMDPIDLDDKLGAQDAALKRASAALLAGEAQIQEVSARNAYAQAQAKRYEQLWAARAVSQEGIDAKRQELQVTVSTLAAARANLEASRQDMARLRADRDGLARQRGNLRLLSPVDGLVARRNADPGTTVVAGQSVIEVVEPGSVWVNVRFDQQRARGLQAGLAARIVLRSQTGEPLAGLVSRVEPYADAVTEETLAKIEFKQAPATLPPLGELAEVTVALPAHKAMPVVPNASVQRVDGKLGVWVVDGNSLRFAPVTLGVADLEGRTQVLQGLSGGERVVSYSHKTLAANSRFTVVDQIAGKAS